MRLYIYISLFASMFLIAIYGCTPSNDAKLEYFPVKIDMGDRWSLIDPFGKFLYIDEFEREPSIVVNGVFFVNENMGYSLYRADRKPNLIPNAVNLKQAGFYTNGVIPIVREGQRISLIDINGQIKTTLNPIKGKEITSCLSRFRDGNLLVGVQGGKYGTVDKKGNIVINPIYDWLVNFSEGIGVAGIQDLDDNEIKTLVGFNNQGKELFKIRGAYELTYFTALGFQGDRLVIKKRDALGYLDKKGDFNKLPSKYSDYRPFSKKYYGFKNTGGKWGLVNESNEILIRPKFDSIDYIGEDLFCVRTNDEYQLVTSEGNIKVELDEKDIISLYGLNQSGISNPFCLIGGQASALMFFNRKGKPIYKEDFDEIGLKQLNGGDMYIVSNYMDITGIAHYIANAINKTGFGNLQLGSNMSKFLKDEDPKYYAYRHSYPINLTDFEFLNASASLTIESPANEPFALSEANYTYNYYGYMTDIKYRYRWNPDSKLKTIILEIHGTSLLNQCAALLVNLLNNKGFEVVKQTGSDIWYLTQGNTHIYVSIGDSDCLKIQIY